MRQPWVRQGGNHTGSEAQGEFSARVTAVIQAPMAGRYQDTSQRHHSKVER